MIRRKNSLVAIAAVACWMGLAACGHDQQPANNPSGSSTPEPGTGGDQYGNTMSQPPSSTSGTGGSGTNNQGSGTTGGTYNQGSGTTGGSYNQNSGTPGGSYDQNGSTTGGSRGGGTYGTPSTNPPSGGTYPSTGSGSTNPSGGMNSGSQGGGASGNHSGTGGTGWGPDGGH